MSKRQKIVVIGRERAYDEERWKQLIISLTYALHERRKQLEDAEHETKEAAE